MKCRATQVSLLPKLIADSEAWHSCWMMLALFLEEKEDEGEGGEGRKAVSDFEVESLI